jgi:hypothetical protein
VPERQQAGQPAKRAIGVIMVVVVVVVARGSGFVARVVGSVVLAVIVRVIVVVSVSVRVMAHGGGSLAAG